MVSFSRKVSRNGRPRFGARLAPVQKYLINSSAHLLQIDHGESLLDNDFTPSEIHHDKPTRNSRVSKIVFLAIPCRGWKKKINPAGHRWYSYVQKIRKRLFVTRITILCYGVHICVYIYIFLETFSKSVDKFDERGKGEQSRLNFCRERNMIKMPWSRELTEFIISQRLSA